MDEGSCQISATVFTLANSCGSYLAVFSKNPMNIFHASILNTVCLKKCSFIRVIARCDRVNLLIFLTIYIFFFFFNFFYALYFNLA